MTSDHEGPTSARPPEGPALTMIRGALLAGVLLFGATTWYSHRGEWSPSPYPVALEYAPAIFLILALVITVFLRIALGPNADAGRRGRLGIMAWVMSEMPALWGAVYYWASDDPKWLIAGIAMLVISFLLFPLKERR